MKVGVSMTSSYPRSMDVRTAGRQMVERAAAIRAAGLHSLFVGDHHATPSPYFQNVPVLGRMLAETGDMMVGALFLAPLHHPVLMAEQVGTLAALAEGPFVLVVAAGDDEAQFAPFGVSLKNRPSRLEEHLSIVQRLLAGERVSLEGKYHTLNDVVVNPVPPERMPVWIGASARPAIERTARMADGWLASPGASGEILATQVDMYRQAAARYGKRPQLIARRDVYVGETDAEAEEATKPVLERGYRGFSREALIFGSPETVLEQLREVGSLGFTHVLIRHIVPQQDLVLASYRRLGEFVVPALA